MAAHLSSITVGVDLASKPEKTGLCVIEWQADGARVVEIARGKSSQGEVLDDRYLVELLTNGPKVNGEHRPADKVGIDAPFGWPVDFVNALSRQGDREPAGFRLEDLGPGKAERLALRETDIWVQRVTGKRPLSVSSDLIAYPARRCAALLNALPQPVDLAGAGTVCEVYPAAALIRWNEAEDGFTVPTSGYKGKQGLGNRKKIIDALDEKLGLTGHEWQEACLDHDDCLDALISALVARAAELGQTVSSDKAGKATDSSNAPIDHSRATQEGWIHLPDCSLTGLSSH